jgi:hypothetical protein
MQQFRHLLFMTTFIRFLLAVAVLTLATGATGGTYGLGVDTNGSITTPAWAKTNSIFPGSLTANEYYGHNVGHGDRVGIVFGREYLFAWYSNIMAGATSQKIVLAGDSTTLGSSIVNSAYLLENAISNSLYGSLSGLTITNMGVSSSNTADWRTNQIAGQLALNPDVLIARHGLNDGSANRANFESDLRGALTTARASKNVSQMTIILMTPNSVNDSPNGRNDAWLNIAVPIIRKAARDFQCCFIDTYTSFHDSTNANAWMDNPYSDGRHIHPLEAENLQIAALIADTLLPFTVSKQLGTANLNNPGSSLVIANVTNLPSTYPKGISLFRAYTGWPIDGLVMTLRQNDNIYLQFNTGYLTNRTAWRNGIMNAWGAWNWPMTADYAYATNTLTVNGHGMSPSLNNANVCLQEIIDTQSYTKLVTTVSWNAPYIAAIQHLHATAPNLSFPIALNPLGGNVGIGTVDPKSVLHVVGLPAYANNAAAVAAGLTAGAFYRTGSDPDAVCVVH